MLSKIGWAIRVWKYAWQRCGAQANRYVRATKPFNSTVKLSWHYTLHRLPTIDRQKVRYFFNMYLYIKAHTRKYRMITEAIVITRSHICSECFGFRWIKKKIGEAFCSKSLSLISLEITKFECIFLKLLFLI